MAIRLAINNQFQVNLVIRKINKILSNKFRKHFFCHKLSPVPKLKEIPLIIFPSIAYQLSSLS